MENLREIRNELLSLHKTLMDIERSNHEAEFGKVTNLQLLNLLFENERFIWLRDISGIVAEIDELFASKSGLNYELGNQLYIKVNSLFDQSGENELFKSKYQANLDTENTVSEHHQKIINLIKKERA